MEPEIQGKTLPFCGSGVESQGHFRIILVDSVVVWLYCTLFYAIPLRYFTLLPTPFYVILALRPPNKPPKTPPQPHPPLPQATFKGIICGERGEAYRVPFWPNMEKHSLTFPGPFEPFEKDSRHEIFRCLVISYGLSCNHFDMI